MGLVFPKRGLVGVVKARSYGVSVTALVAAVVLAHAALAANLIAPHHAPSVLHVGDSFVGSGFAQALKPKFRSVGINYFFVSKAGAYTTTLPYQIGLSQLMLYRKPIMTIITLGANEMSMPVPELHAAAVRKLVAMVVSGAATEGHTCVWALPPPWHGQDSGIFQVIKREAWPCQVYDPSAIASRIARGPDGIHPSLEGGALWADAFLVWLLSDKGGGVSAGP